MAKAKRAFTLVLAVLFLATSLGFTGLVIWQATSNQDNAADITNELNNLEGETMQDNADQLQGTKLQNFDPLSGVDELQIVDLQEGDGETVNDGATVTAHYTGALAKDGTIFESSKDSGQPATFPLSGVIQGWQEGVPGMKVGGIRRLIIPASLAYGEQGSPPVIGPDEALVFDIELISVN